MYITSCEYGLNNPFIITSSFFLHLIIFLVFHLLILLISGSKHFYFRPPTFSYMVQIVLFKVLIELLLGFMVICSIGQLFEFLKNCWLWLFQKPQRSTFFMKELMVFRKFFNLNFFSGNCGYRPNLIIWKFKNQWVKWIYMVW
jgi:hypothetical protein